MSELLYKEEVYKIIGAAMEVYNEHGSGFPEPVYQESMEIELERRSIPFIAQPEFSISYKGQRLKKHFVPDLITYGKIIVELKVVESLTDKERSQLFHYLKASKFALGLLINFGSHGKLEWERIIYSKNLNDPEHEF